MTDLSYLDEVVNSGERLRADARQTVLEILTAADRVLNRDPSATLEEIAAEAGVARTTIHRRFATREALLEALELWSVRQIVAAIDAANTRSVPPYVALFQATANVMRVKINQSFTRTMSTSASFGVVTAHERIVAKADELLGRLQEAGQLGAEVSIPWARRVYYALMHEAVQSAAADADPDELATLVVGTFLNGVGPNEQR